MSKRTVLNEKYRGLVENFSIPADIHTIGDKKFASCAGVVPIHCCTPEEIAEKAKTTHHIADIFNDEVPAPLEELVYVRLDETHAEKVFINRTKRILLVSADGVLASWRAAPTFESANLFIAGTPIVNKEGALVSVVTVKRGNHYAVSGFEGEGGYFDTTKQWKILDTPERKNVYGDKIFDTREKLREYIASIPDRLEGMPTPVLHRGSNRISLVAENGRQIAQLSLQGVISSDVEYL